jgi:hypothetical protein
MWLGSLMGLRALIVRWRFIDFEKKRKKKKDETGWRSSMKNNVNGYNI